MKCKCGSEAIVGTPWGEFRCCVCNSKHVEMTTYDIEPFDPDNEMPCYNEDEDEYTRQTD